MKMVQSFAFFQSYYKGISAVSDETERLAL